jgi:hypothetical protein
VGFLVGFGLTPEALAMAPVATEGRTPMIIASWHKTNYAQ